MTKKTFERAFSKQRTEKYFKLYPNTNQAISLYQSNIELAEALYPVMAVLEVALRNSINTTLVTLFGCNDWYVPMATLPALNNLSDYVCKACTQIAKRKEVVAPAKIIAELTLGFWVSLFNSNYERLLWKNLKFAFLHMPKKIRQRKKIVAILYKFRHLRNRISHHEPICWDIKQLEQLNKLHADMIQLIGWINPKLPPWLATFDRFDEVYNNTMTKLS
jgi:hypothetical protein